LGPRQGRGIDRNQHWQPEHVLALLANTNWALDGSRVFVVVRDNATVEADRSVFFASDRWPLRRRCDAALA